MPSPCRHDYEPFPRPVRMAALARAGGQCEACGRDDLPLVVDHVVPQAMGGSNTLANAQVLCVPCHGVKSLAERQHATAQYVAHRRERRQQTVRYVEQHPTAPHESQARSTTATPHPGSPPPHRPRRRLAYSAPATAS